MANVAKQSVITWWIFSLMSFFLWYRNCNYDRAIAPFLFVVGLAQLIEYGAYSNADPQQSGNALFITLWLQCLVLAISVYIFIKTYQENNESYIETILGLNVLLFSFVFLISIVCMFNGDNNYATKFDSNGNLLWLNDNQSMLGKWQLLYAFGILFPFFLLLIHYKCNDITLSVVIIYILFIFSYVLSNYSIEMFNSKWCYFALGIPFIMWIGKMYTNQCG